MSRRIIYRIQDAAGNHFTESQWDEVERLQHWYNSEFSWSTGRLAIKRYILFPNTEENRNADPPIWELIGQRHANLRAQGLMEPAIISQMEKEGLIFVKWGGYYDNCLASGFTRVADNEWNAYLVCDFLLKASTLCPNARINVHDEGKFVKSEILDLLNGDVEVRLDNARSGVDAADLCAARRIFAIVDDEKYKRHPAFRNMVPEFNRLKMNERKRLVRNWNWLGYDGNFEAEGDDTRGVDLNSKVRAFVTK